MRESPWLNGTFRLGLSAAGGDKHYGSPTGAWYDNRNATFAPIGANYSVKRRASSQEAVVEC